jgi:photosystem II stability/assembly factor-like uncharacterized protein
MQTGRFLGSCLCVLITGAASAGDAEWTSTGPLGGRVHEIVFDPTNAQRAYATTLGGVFRSVDGGNSWTSASRGIVADTNYPLPLIIDAEQPTKLYTFDSWGRIYRTDNRGDNWAILPDTLPSDVHPSALADKPGFSCVVFLGTATSDVGRGAMLFKSTDCGQSFFQIGNGLPSDDDVVSIAFDPADLTNNTLLVGLTTAFGVEDHAIWRSTDGGLTFTPTFSTFYPGQNVRPQVTQISFGPGGSVWAAAGSYSVFHSTNAGQNWFDTSATGVSAIVADPVDSDIVWVGGAEIAGNLEFDGSSYAFTEIITGLTGNATYDNGIRSVPAGVDRLAWRGGASPKLFASTEGSGIFGLTSGAGPTWVSVAANPAGAGIRALAIHPSNPQRIFAGQATYSISSPALYRTDNGGTTWAPSNIELEAADIQALAIDPTTTANVATTTVYAGGRSANNLPDEFKRNGLYRSDDGGQSWFALDGNLPPIADRSLGAVRALVLDGNSCALPPCTTANGPLQRVYSVGHGRIRNDLAIADDTHRVIRSNDRGVTWVALDVNPGFPRSNRIGTTLGQRVTPTSIAINPNNTQVVYVGTEAEFFDYDTGDDEDLDPARESGLFVSTNAGATWSRVNGLPMKINSTIYPNASLDVVDVLVDPVNSNVLWVAMRDLFASSTSTIYRSGNAGASWQLMDNGINASLELRDLAFDPQNPNIVYATSGGNGANPGAVYRGVWDNGTQSMLWLSISVGLPAESAFTIAVDPANPNLLHAGTDTGVHSITRAPDQDGDGIPDDDENMAPDVPGGLNGPGDGNGDGILDSAQRDVGSSVIIIRDPHGSSAVTSIIVSGTGPSPDACNQAVDVSAINSGELAVDIDARGNEILHPFPARQFEIIECATAIIDVTYHGADFTAPDWSFRYFGPRDAGDQEDFGWYPLPTVTRTGVSTWRLQLSADGFGSYRPELDAIRFVGGPACNDDRLYADGLESTPTVMASCVE